MNDVPSQPPSSDASASPPARKKRPVLWRSFWLTFLAVSLVAAWYSFYAPPNSVAWAESYVSAQQEAADTGKPIILFFTGEWCAPCRVMKRQVWADPEVAALVNAQFVTVAVDVDDAESAPLMERYNVVGPPVTIVTDAQGNALRWRAGRVGKTEFLELLSPSDPS